MKRLHPATIVVCLLPRLREVITQALPLLAGTYFAGHGHTSGDLIAAGIGGFTGIFAIGSYWTTRYGIEPDHVALKTGWIFRRDRRIPLPQIQNVEIRQNVLERLLRVATIDVETARGKGHDLKLSVLGLEDAERFREELLHAAHLTGNTAAKLDEPLVTLTRHDLWLGALTENHFAQEAAVALTLLGPVITALAHIAKSLPQTSGFIVMTLGLCGLGVGAWLWGAVGYYLRYANFVVYRQPHLLRISYGMLARMQLAIRPNRIELVRLTTTIPQRWMQRCSLYVGTASTFGEAGVLAPLALFVERYRAREGVRDLIPGLRLGELAWQPWHPLYFRRAFFRGGFVSFIAAGYAAFLVHTFSEFSVLSLSLIALGFLALLLPVILLALSRPETGFAITEDAVVVRRGYYHQIISAMPIERIEIIRVHTPFFWRRAGVHVVAIQAMKNVIHIGAMPDDALNDLRRRWHEKIELRAQSHLYERLATTPSDDEPLALPDLALAPEDVSDDEAGHPSAPPVVEPVP